ncbi:two-component system sensor histidine kinase NtrB [Comamonas jiangduensis]|uniref:two-component system sensor histidine kinase NtrB n=1 Tax=Comamonas jiangduensis TaxID=1194168 RepID=UPI0024E19447|nr:ATP-binding protein [Comamonas jiangduensis]
MLVVLVAGMLIMMVWLAGRYEASQVQDKLDRDAAQAVVEIRASLNRNLQDLQAVNALHTTPEQWSVRVAEMLQVRRELLRVEWRDADMHILRFAETPYRAIEWESGSREESFSNVVTACANAKRTSSSTYSSSYFQILGEAMGAELMEVCLPQMEDGQLKGFMVGTYSLQNILLTQLSKNLTQSQEVSFTEPDGTRLALVGAAWRGSRVFTSQQLLDLPGNTMVLRMDSWHRAPSVFPNVMTATVTGMAIALASVVVILVRDNRRRLRAERDLGDAFAFRKAMEDSLITGLRARDLQGRISYVNPAFCAMVGFSAEELLGQSFAPYWPPELAEEYVRRQARRLAGAIPAAREGHESVFMRKDGTRFPVLIFEAPLINAQGQQTGWMSAFIDITEQRRMEELSRASHERLQATARLATVGEMASLLSHELTQPLMAMSSYANGSLNMLRNDGDLAQLDHAMLVQRLQDVESAMQRIAFQADRAGKVIKSVRDFVRRRSQTHEVISAHDLLEAVMPLVRLQASKLGVQVQVEVEPRLPPILCDTTMIEQVLLNLARNAMQAMEGMEAQQRKLTIKALWSESSQRVVFAVEDQGCGIPPEVAAQLFTPFFTTKHEGMGLGLSMCRTVLEQHGGELRYQANAPRGTVFTFSLPVAEI